ncbi:hypothetical protein [Corynebacterium glaucum]|nr:hypothetical protein [Corynebacterium glaucum]
MNFLALSDTTAPTARAHLPDTSTLPTAQLSPSLAATALAAVQHKEHLLIDGTLRRLSNHLDSIATFAQTAADIDAALDTALDTALARSLRNG